MAVGDLIDATEYEEATGQTVDQRLPYAITAASGVIRRYLQRNVGMPNVTETRTFEYDDSGVAEVDDFTAPTVVTINSVVVAVADYIPMPRSAPGLGLPYFYLYLEPIQRQRLAGWHGGFFQNLDRLVPWQTFPPTTVGLAATFGWPTIPQDIKQAATWTVEDWLAADPASGGGPGGSTLTGESIVDYSRSWSAAGGGPVAPLERSAIPARAQAILDNFQRDPVV